MKIKLPKAVAEELAEFIGYIDVGFDDYYEVSLEDTSCATYYYIMSETLESDRNARIVNLLNAWTYGWEEADEIS
ncbi:hypothetical protein FC84_GL001613 [Lapidilactobacillus dextrinicus DSM 20335]|uniref:Uncharacterized protein n=1 Tax=Lapidilactobacillus dextrinicus DSM 20335 TaxID=1423738 RepID=A0A0R2BIT6_9LACO|nr:hypothetical protein [Lapidilactobacillus dextrinicus]KRM79437.1 hypothetical protein FC84_GL001613 [Lapidilactobacillus dextrinicus DSM 20335]QFG46733.1 hypothetical protein LH506_04410 [Lapidilactobacillus dextrinicus]